MKVIEIQEIGVKGQSRIVCIINGVERIIYTNHSVDQLKEWFTVSALENNFRLFY